MGTDNTIASNDSPSSPSKVDTVRCAAPGCEQIRRVANHWWIVWSDSPGGMWHCVGYDAGMFAAVGDQARAVCGQACADILFQRYLAGEKI